MMCQDRRLYDAHMALPWPGVGPEPTAAEKLAGAQPQQPTEDDDCLNLHQSIGWYKGVHALGSGWVPGDRNIALLHGESPPSGGQHDSRWCHSEKGAEESQYLRILAIVGGRVENPPQGRIHLRRPGDTVDSSGLRQAPLYMLGLSGACPSQCATHQGTTRVSQVRYQCTLRQLKSIQSVDSHEYKWLFRRSVT
jgi:hypothetical protein